MEKFAQNVIAVGVFLAGAGVFWHYVFYVPGQERERAAATLQEAQSRKLQYAQCLSDAASAYEAAWASACSRVASETKKSFQDCLKDKLVMENQFLGRAHCEKTFGTTDGSPSCALPKETASTIDARLTDAKEKCVTEAKLAL